MTEQEWLVSDDSIAMLEFLNPSSPDRCVQRASDLQLRLFCCACCDALLGKGRGLPYEGKSPAGDDDLSWARSWSQKRSDCHPQSALGQSPSNFDSVRAAILRDIVGNPFRRLGRFGSTAIIDCTMERLYGISQTARSIAQAIYANRTFEDIPILADALEDCGCDNEEILTHCRGENTHVRGCWVLDLILGKE